MENYHFYINNENNKNHQENFLTHESEPPIIKREF